MAVIVRETREIAGEEHTVKVYETDEALTEEQKRQAEELDQILSSKMESIIEELEENELLDRVNSPGSLEMWYTVGKNLQFIGDLDMLSTRDRRYVWRALYDHAGPLHQNDEVPERAKRSPKTSYFHYCYLLAQYDWETVKAGGTWTTWVEIFDSKPIRDDQRIIDWLVEQIQAYDGGIQEWVRPLNKAIRNEFQGKDTSVFTDEELEEKLDHIMEEVHG